MPDLGERRSTGLAHLARAVRKLLHQYFAIVFRIHVSVV